MFWHTAQKSSPAGRLMVRPCGLFDTTTEPNWLRTNASEFCSTLATACGLSTLPVRFLPLWGERFEPADVDGRAALPAARPPLGVDTFDLSILTPSRPALNAQGCYRVTERGSVGFGPCLRSAKVRLSVTSLVNSRCSPLL